MVDEAFRASRLLRLFEQVAGNQTTLSKPFLQWPTQTRDRVRTEAGICLPEYPFLAYIKDDDEWTIVTLTRIVWKEDGQLHRVHIGDLDDATIPEDVIVGLTPVKKRELGRLKLITKDGREVIAPFEPGKAFA